MRTFAVGDIHGCLDQLESLMARVQEAAHPGDSLVFLGDYIDRGPNSRGVIDYLLDLRGRWEGPLVFLIGNHEDMLLDYQRVAWGGYPLYEAGMWLNNGGVQALKNYSTNVELLHGLAFLPETHREFLFGLQLDHEDEHAYYVHAGLVPGKSPAACSRFEKLWIRDGWIYNTEQWLEKPVVFGHTPQSEAVQQRLWRPGMKENFQPLNRPEKIGIDTGSCFGGYLSAVQLPERRFLRSVEL